MKKITKKLHNKQKDKNYNVENKDNNTDNANIGKIP